MKKTFLCSIFIAFCLALPAMLQGANPVTVTGLRTDQLVNPMGLDIECPRLGWQIQSSKKNVMQTAYHLLVASSPVLLEKEVGDLWDSGTVKSDASLWIPYGGGKLKPNQRCYWKVKVSTTQGDSGWSAPARWSMGLQGESHWQGQWIGMDKPAPWDSDTQWSRLSSRYLRKEFAVKKQVKQATVHIAGLGMYELYINGMRIGDQVLAPGDRQH